MMDLIINENVLLPEYVPKRLPGREKEIADIAYNFKVALDGRKPENLLIYGPPGTGKTAVIKYVSSELEEFSNKIKIVYINCWHVGTRHNIIASIARSVGFISPMKGISIDSILSRTAEIIKKRKYSVIVILDEMDRLIAGGHGDVLYDISRMNEVHKVNMSVVGVVNDFELVTTLDPRIRSSAINRDVEFKPYTVQALKKILSERADLALKYYDEEAVALCAAHAYKLGGDARRGIGLLLAAARIAERKELNKLDVESVEEAVKSVKKYGKESKAEVELGEVEKRIISIIKKEEGINSGELYKKMKDINDRTVRNYIIKLSESGIIKIEKGQKGNTRILKLRKYGGE